MATAGVTGYLPGLLKHQTVRLALNHQKEYPESMTSPAFVNLIPLPRGLRGIFGEVLAKYSIDYVTPLLYPDLEIGPVLYLKRVHGALWADHMIGKNVIVRDPDPRYASRNYSTYGIDLIADIHLFRIFFPVSVGGRLIYLPETGTTRFEWIYSVEIN